MSKPAPKTRSILFDELDPVPAICFAVVTAVDIERDEMLRRMRPLDGEELVLKLSAAEGTYYVGNCGLYPCVLVTCEAGSGGRQGSTVTIIDALDRWRPYAVILVGIAFGRDREKQVIGDVLVSTQVIPYELQRVGEDGSIPRGPEPEADATMLDRVRHLGWSWKPAGEPRRSPRRGPILSGDKLVDNPEFKAALFKTYPEAEGGEMEGAGLYAAAARRRVAWLVVKAICDWGENKDKGGQPLAADNACSLVEALLSERSLRAEDLGAHASPAQSRAERALHDQTRRTKLKEVQSAIRDAYRRQLDAANDQAKLIAENLDALQGPEPPASLLARVDLLQSARGAAMEEWLNAYNDGCASFLRNDIDKKEFADMFGPEIRTFCTSEAKEITDLMQPRHESDYDQIWGVYDELGAVA